MDAGESKGGLTMPNCEHIHWHVEQSNTVGYATCDDCGKEVHIAFLFESLKNRMEIALERIEKIVANCGRE